MKSAYLDYYRPLIQGFCKRLPEGDLPGLNHLPQPFLPLFGRSYESSALRIVFVGQDTKSWGDCRKFVEEETLSPGSAIAAAFDPVENLEFRRWRKNTHSFFGFVMAMMASLHGLPNWNVLKWGGYENLLGSFGWANINAIELWESLNKHTNQVPYETWRKVREAGAHLNRFAHIEATLNPRVVILTVKSADLNTYFEGYDLAEVPSEDSRIRHYRVEGRELDVFHTYHPGYMRRVGGPRDVLTKIQILLEREGLAPDFPDFISDEGAQKEVMEYLIRSAPKADQNPGGKYDFIAWVAIELCKHGAVMSVPCLVDMLNECGYRTNRGTRFQNGRGAYKLVHAAYDRQQEKGLRDRIARSFCKPDFTYAYE